MNSFVIFDHLGLLGGGVWMTFKLTSISLFCGLMISIPLAIARTSRFWWLSSPVRLYVYLVRGTPLLVQIFIIYYGLGQLTWLRESIFWVLFKEAYFCALVALTLNTTAYTTELVRGAMQLVPVEFIEAAKSLGLSTPATLRWVTLPTAFRQVIPSYSNEVILMLHASSLASVITLLDLTGVARMLSARYYSPFETFLPVAVIYCLLTFMITRLFKWIERKLSIKD